MEAPKELIELFEEFDSDILTVSDCDMIHHGTRIDCIALVDGNVQFWAGDPECDKYAEELVVDQSCAWEYIEQIINEL